MGFPGTWMTESEDLIYRVVPKCACSTVGQAMYYMDQGEYYDGDIHDATHGIHKWGIEESKPKIENRVRSGDAYTFTTVRNPYTRILSAFFDKIAGIQRNGVWYRGNLVPKLSAAYGVVVDGEFDQIASFRRFLLFARDTIIHRKPMDPDIHWSGQAGHISTLIANGGHYDEIIFTEKLSDGLKSVFSHIDAKHPVDVDAMPRFNESEGHGPKRAHPVEDYFDDLSRHLTWEIYHKDFELFKYDPNDPSNKYPVGEIDLNEVHAKLSGR